MVRLRACPCSLMDRISDSGSDDRRSIRLGGTRYARGATVLLVAAPRFFHTQDGPLAAPPSSSRFADRMRDSLPHPFGKTILC